MFHVPPQFTQLTALVPAPVANLLRIVIAGEPSAREGLASLAGAFEDLVVVDDVDPDDRLAARLRVLTPDVLLCEIGQDTAALASLGTIATPSLLLLKDRSQRSLAIASGARGVIDRSAPPRRIHAALHAVGEGLRVYDAHPGEPSQLREHHHALPDPLTARELDVLHLLAAGMTNKEIAARLGITEHTVKFHVNAILGKLAVETRTEAVVHAARLGIVVI